mmetsp:Transcript_24979/g.69688  ORF Transcript_24979/g.69688 Transcript_24979/m.69688 type:complete len:87 (-) Transcript_24979:2078-2338(-)
MAAARPQTGGFSCRWHPEMACVALLILLAQGSEGRNILNPRCKSRYGCDSCLEAGCAWQGDGKCYDSCLVQDTSCYTGSPTACPTQ